MSREREREIERGTEAGGREDLMKSRFFLGFYEDTISRREPRSHFLTVMESRANSFCLFPQRGVT